MLRRLYDRLIELAESEQAYYWLALIAFCEGIFFPIPPDVMVIPMVIAGPRRFWKIAGVCAAASICGGMVGYSIGFFVYETVGRFIIGTFGLQEAYANFQAMFHKWGFWIVLPQGATPIPWKIVTIACGAAKMNFLVFLSAAIFTRSARFFVEASLVRIFGQPVRSFIEDYLPWVTGGFLALIVGGFLAIRFL